MAKTPEVMTMAKNFFKAMHTNHNKGKITSRSISETRKCAKAKQNNLFPSLGANTLPVTPTRGGREDPTTLLQGFITLHYRTNTVAEHFEGNSVFPRLPKSPTKITNASFRPNNLLKCFEMSHWWLTTQT
jgi:hypothetical protein